MQMEFDYRQSLRQQDMVIDLQMQERAKQWEIDKMQLRSQMDFQREEQQRQRKLDSIDSSIQQIDKEVLAGRITEQEAYPIKQKLEISKTGVSIPISAFEGEDKDRFGVRPYYLEPEFERDFPELAAAKKKEVISGQRRGTVPYYLDPEWLRANRDIAMQVLESKGVLLEEDEIDALIGEEPTTEQPELMFRGYGKDRLATKQLDVGVRGEVSETPLEQVVPEALPEPTTKAEFDVLSKGTRFRAPDGTVRIK